jgi:phosphohistidine phosphatase
MIRLLLIRHAKSSWDEPGLPDHARPINARGHRGAAAIGRWLAGRAADRPDLAIVSDARRTRETWSRLEAETGELPERFEPALYDASAEAIIRVLRAAPPAARLALVGHNPGVAEAARRLLADPPRSPDFAKYPTAATTVMDFDAAEWSAVDWGTGLLVAFVTPKILAEG